MKETLKSLLRDALKAIGAPEDTHIEIEVPREEKFGDLSSPVAMGLARALKKNPRQIAEDIIANLPGREMFSNIEIAGPGFINFTFIPAFLQKALSIVLTDGAASLRSDIGQGRKIQIEYVSANPTGPLHLGHGRGAALGGALAKLLQAAGYDVTCEYYVNDAGRQVIMLGESVFCRYLALFGKDYPMPEDGYRGEYVEDVAREMKDSEGDRYINTEFGDVERIFIDFALERMLGLIKKDLGEFNIPFDSWQSERALHEEGSVKHAVEFLRDKGLIYEKDGAIWFNAEKFGDDKDRVVIKSDGTHTYFASDIAYHLKKVESGFEEVIDIWGADHHGYVARMEAVMDALGPGREKLTVLLVQMVSLMRGGEPVQMSKRAGEFVTLKDLIDEVGADIVKFIFLTRRHDSQLAFDLEAAKAESSENPVFYVQYAGARVNSIFIKAESEGVDTSGLEAADLSALTHEDELRLMRKILGYSMAFEQAARAREPHKITFYLQELAGQFHPFYNVHRVIGDDQAQTRARLALCKAVRLVIVEGLTLLGLSSPDRM